MRGRQLLVERGPAATRRLEQVAIQALEIAGNRLGPSDGFNAVDGGRVTFDGQAGLLLAVDVLNLINSFVNGVGQMGGSAAGFAAANGPGLDHRDGTAGLAE